MIPCMCIMLPCCVKVFVPGEVVLLIVRGEMAVAEDGWWMQSG